MSPLRTIRWRKAESLFSASNRAQRIGRPSLVAVQYRSEFVGDAKAVVVGMTSNGFTLADPNDCGMLDVVGFDTSVSAVIADFVRS